MTPLCNSDIFCTSFTAESTMREERREKRSWKEKREERKKKHGMKRSEEEEKKNKWENKEVKKKASSCHSCKVNHIIS